jgi:hypothetical protein
VALQRFLAWRKCCTSSLLAQRTEAAQLAVLVTTILVEVIIRGVVAAADMAAAVAAEPLL